MIEKLLINEFIEVMPYGATCPIKVEANNNKVYIIKTKNNSVAKDGNGLFRELYSYGLLKKLNYKCIPDIKLVEITDNDIIKIKSIIDIDNPREKEAFNNLKKSIGINLAIEWIPNTEIANIDPDNDKEFIYKVLYTDGYLLNADRTIDNPNILYDGENYHLIDFSESFFYGMIFDELDKYNTKCIFDNRYLLYSSMVDIVNNYKIQSIDNIHNIFLDIPNQWLNRVKQEDISSMISSRMSNKEIFNEKNI